MVTKIILREYKEKRTVKIEYNDIFTVTIGSPNSRRLINS